MQKFTLTPLILSLSKNDTRGKAPSEIQPFVGFGSLGFGDLGIWIFEFV
jgi:hypothetical protein